MPRWICPSCDAVMNVKPVHIGQTAACVSCGRKSEVFDTDAFSEMLSDSDELPATPIADEPPKPKEYKVLSQKDKWFSGKFDPALLEQALNSYAQQGWILKAAVTASIAGFGGNREELVMILER